VSARRIDPRLGISEIADFEAAPDVLAAPSLKPVLSRPGLYGATPAR